MQLFGVGHSLVAAAHIRLGDDFQQGRAGAVQVDTGLADEVFVQRFARIFFQMRAHQTHGLGLAIQKERHRTALHHRNLKLADLVALGQVRVEIVLTREHAARCDVRTQRQPELDGAFDCSPVHHRQRTG